ncbi:insulinase family protein [Bacillus sp. HMF5848]|uniref:EF-P 5-aminopentanol modification-associated protein YfmH n=1 Tax=Bacillus sp. HMF5848 TaxID=2495421 RepID=UPI000F7941DD|nr:pitrilysin family protein [Bacillus sp. HMF5848]RSK27094.1 insulinase family protein [Bacillus sp. HMF5848]
MEKITFQQLNESLYFEQLSNGLQVYVLPKKCFNKTYVTFTTKYGSIDNQFTPINQTEMIKVPDGIAHFLEHKLFEKEHGDVFHDFSKQGASANAFTSFTRTAYLFSSTSNVETNLITLLDFVQEPYFTEQTVEKEKGIIGQEITMYDDNPDWRLYFGVIKNMYHNHPVAIDIAGTIESISNITKDMLYDCYHTFYHPSNMILFIVGPLDATEILKIVTDNQNEKQFEPPQEIQRFHYIEPPGVAEEKSVLQMNVHTPKCLVGLKAKQTDIQGAELLTRELAMNVMLEYLFGKSSKHYERLFDAGLIDDSFSFDFTLEQGFGFAIVGGDTQKPDELVKEIKGIYHSFASQNIETDALNRIIKKKIGNFLRAINSPEYIANQFTRYSFNNTNLFEVVPKLEELSVSYIQALAKEAIDDDYFTVCQVIPKEA